jgi:uncharacterized protein (TIGR03000 family)
MFRRIASTGGSVALTVLGWLLSASPATAQNQGYSVWIHKNDGGGSYSGGGGWRSGGMYVPQGTAYYYSAPTFTPTGTVMGGPSRYTSYYYAPPLGSPFDKAASVSVTVPADAKIWIDGSPTTSVGTQRRFESPPFTPGREYTYEFQVSWKQDGRDVTQKRQVRVRAGDVVNLTFPPG